MQISTKQIQAYAPITQQPTALQVVVSLAAMVQAMRGETAPLTALNAARAALKVHKVKGTDSVLSLFKAFPSHAEAKTLHTAARQQVIAEYRAAGGKAKDGDAAWKAACDPTFRAAADKILSAGKALGWDAVREAASVGSLYDSYQKKTGTGRYKAKGAKGETMPDEPETRQDAPAAAQVQATPVQAALAELAGLVSGMDEAAAMKVLTGAIKAAMKAAAKQAA